MTVITVKYGAILPDAESVPRAFNGRLKASMRNLRRLYRLFHPEETAWNSESMSVICIMYYALRRCVSRRLHIAYTDGFSGVLFSLHTNKMLGDAFAHC